MSNPENKTIVITGEDNIKAARILTLRSALKLEIKGLGRRGRSVYSIVKEEFGFKGNKQKVLDQLNAWIKTNLNM
jgi:hypothetical protein